FTSCARTEIYPLSLHDALPIFRLPPSSMLRAAPKNFFGPRKAFESTPPDRIFPLGGTVALYARARRVMESSRITTSRPCSTKRRSEEHTSELQSRENLVCRLLL